MEAFYRRYLECCNARRFDDLAGFLTADVEVNGERYGVDRYVTGVRQVVLAAPDFHWEIQQVLVAGDHLAVRLTDTGTTVAGRPFSIQELAIYRVVDGRIAAVWGDLDHTRL
jgi:predicted ester cyclase